MLFFRFNNAGPSSSKWRFLTSGDNANALHAKGDSCFAEWESVVSSARTERSKTTYNKAKDAMIINTNDVFMAATLRLQVDFKSKGKFQEKRGNFRSVFSAKGGEFITSPPQDGFAGANLGHPR